MAAYFCRCVPMQSKLCAAAGGMLHPAVPIKICPRLRLFIMLRMSRESIPARSSDLSFLAIVLFALILFVLGRNHTDVTTTLKKHSVDGGKVIDAVFP
jgi:hypothetical protein